MARRKEREKLRGIYEHPPGSECWWIQYFDAAGKRRREKAGTHSNTVALLAKRKTEKLEGRKLPEKGRRSLTFGTLLDDALTHSKAANGEQSTYQLRLKYDTIRETFETRIVDQIGKADILNWLTDQAEERDWEPATFNRWKAAFSLAFSVAIDNEKLDRNPAALIPRKKENNGRLLFLQDAEQEQNLLDAVGDEFPTYVPAVLVSLHTGIRASEQWRLRWTDIDFSRQLLTVRNTKNGDPERHIPMNSVVVQTLRTLRGTRKTDGLIFRDTEEIVIADTRDWFVPCLKIAGVESGYTWHCNRHTFGSRLTMAGVDLRTVAKLMGHKNIQMTMRYAHLAPNHELNAVERLVPGCEAPSATRTATRPKRPTMTVAGNANL